MHNSKKPLVSIVIPTFNNRNYVVDAVKSALEQTYENVEIVVVDDGSTDETKDVLKSYIEGDKIRYIYQENKGLAGARNTGINVAAGEYVALLDADDLFKPEKIEGQIAHLMECKDCDFSFCDVLMFKDGQPNKFFKYKYKYHSGNVLKYIIRENFINPSTLVFNKERIANKFSLFDDSLRRAEDIEFYFRVSIEGARFCFLDKPLFISRVREGGNLQANQAFVQETTLKVLRGIEDKLTPEEKELYKFDEVIDIRKFKLALAYLAGGERALGRKTVMEIRGRYLSKCIVVLVSLVPRSIARFLVAKMTELRRIVLFKRNI